MKPRLKYGEFAVSKRPTVAELIERYEAENAERIGRSEHYTFAMLKRSPDLGPIVAASLKATNFVDHCRKRKEGGAQPATVTQDMTYLRIVLATAFELWEIEGCGDAVSAFQKGKRFCDKYNLTGKSRPRDRRPTDEEIAQLLAYFDEQDKRSRIKMRPVVEFSLFSARRISETCRLRWGDVNGADQTCIVRDMKDPRQKKGNDHEFPLLGRAWDIVMAQPRLTENPDERIFPYNAKSCGQRYTAAKKVLNIVGLHLHDNRRESASRAFEGNLNGRKYNVPEVMLLTGHKNPQMLMRVYTRLKAKDMHPEKVPEKVTDVLPPSQ